MENSNIIEAGAVIRLNGGVNGVCGDYILARIKPDRYKLIGVDNGNRLKDEPLVETSWNGITLDELQSYLGPRYTFKVIERAEATLKEAAPAPDNGDRGPEVTKAELERLALIAEEAAEVVQIANKIIRHGYQSFNPFDANRITNRSLLEKEFGDLLYVMSLAVDRGDLDLDKIERYAEEKGKRVGKYLHHNTPINADQL